MCAPASRLLITRYQFPTLIDRLSGGEGEPDEGLVFRSQPGESRELEAPLEGDVALGAVGPRNGHLALALGTTGFGNIHLSISALGSTIRRYIKFLKVGIKFFD